jgi:hypothetical protein
MRLLADVFERGRVDIVFSGHVHNYQRSFPLRFAGERRSGEGGDFRSAPDRRGAGPVDAGLGGSTADRDTARTACFTWFPGPAAGACTTAIRKRSRLVAAVHGALRGRNPFADRVDLEGKRLVLRQISATGEELDRIVVSK